MRVCVLVPRFPVVSETFVVDSIIGLRERGHDVVVVTMFPPMAPHVPAGWRDVVAQTAVSRRRVGLSGALRFALRGAHRHRVKVPERFRYALRLTQATPFDVLHAQFGDAGAVAVEMRNAGVFAAPIVTSFHGYDANVRPRQRPGLYDQAVIACERVTVGSEFMRDVVAKLGFPRDRIALWPQGVDTNRFVAIDRSGHAGFQAVTVARLIDVKGIDVALRAVAAARPSIPGLRYTIIGDGELQPRLQELSVELGIADITTFTGALPHDEVRRILGESDVFVLTGRTDESGHTEAQGVAPLEAAATGLPVVGTRSGGLPEVVVDGSTGVLVEPEDVAGAADALIALAADPAWRVRLGAAGREHVAAKFSRQHSLDLIERVYQDCAGGGSL